MRIHQPHQRAGRGPTPADALADAATRIGVVELRVRVDELRRAAEDLGDRYYGLEYFERTTAALRTILLEKGLIAEAELEAKMAQVRARFDVPKAVSKPAKKAGHG